MAVLYLCYQSILEPLTQTQVAAYLEGLAQANFKTLLVTFEPRALTQDETEMWETRLKEKGITWQWLRYHKRPTLPATAWDIFAGIVVGWRLMREHHVELVHARSHVPGIMALVLKRFTGVKFLFDVRGFMAEEYADAGVWSQDGMLFRLTKRAEKRLVGAADGIVILTYKAKDLLRAWYPVETDHKPIEVIPCCVDLRQFGSEEETHAQVNANGAGTTLVYVGKLGGWYPVAEMVAFVASCQKLTPQLHWQVWTQSDAAQLQAELAAQGLTDVSVGRAEPHELMQKLARADAALSLYKRNLSAAGCSPTKIGEYLAAGLPVVSSAGIGDVDALLENQSDGAVGVLVKDASPASYVDAARALETLLHDPNLRERCRAVALKALDLERVGWVRYRKIYQELLQYPSSAQ